MRLHLRTVTLLAAVTVPVGCRTTSTEPIPDTPPPPAARQVPDLKEVRPSSLEPDATKLPGLDAMAVTPRLIFADGAGVFRQLTAEQCRTFAVQNADSARLLDLESQVPDCVPNRGRDTDPCRASAATFLNRVRELAARHERNKAAAEALERFYQLASVEGRVEQLHLGMVVLDKYRALIRNTQPGVIRGITLPTTDELDLQRARSVGLLFEAEKGEELLNLDLKRRIGAPGDTAWRYWPTGDFSVPAAPVDVEAEVKSALENRPDLQLLRFAYLELSPATLPGVKDLLRGAGPMLAPGSLAAALARPHPLVEAVMSRLRPPQGPDPCIVREVAVRKQQLFDLVADKERAAADDVRAKAIALKYQARRVGLARWKLDQVKRKHDDWEKEKPFGEYVEFPILIQWHVARAELIDEVMGWHAAKAKLLEAQGLLVEPGK